MEEQWQQNYLKAIYREEIPDIQNIFLSDSTNRRCPYLRKLAYLIVGGKDVVQSVSRKFLVSVSVWSRSLRHLKWTHKKTLKCDCYIWNRGYIVEKPFAVTNNWLSLFSTEYFRRFVSQPCEIQEVSSYFKRTFTVNTTRLPLVKRIAVGDDNLLRS